MPLGGSGSLRKANSFPTSRKASTTFSLPPHRLPTTFSLPPHRLPTTFSLPRHRLLTASPPPSHYLHTASPLPCRCCTVDRVESTAHGHTIYWIALSGGGGKTLPLPCASATFVSEALPICLVCSTAFVSETLPLLCELPVPDALVGRRYSEFERLRQALMSAPPRPLRYPATLHPGAPARARVCVCVYNA